MTLSTITPLAIGDQLPDLTVTLTSYHSRTLSQWQGQPLIIYFYPKDNTPGCTRESQEFADCYPEFQQQGVEIVGVSRDSLASHDKFKTKLQLPFELIADQEEQLCTLFDVIKEKSLYGKKYLGIERSTFLIDSRGMLRQEWRKIKVANHVNSVLAALPDALKS